MAQNKPFNGYSKLIWPVLILIVVVIFSLTVLTVLGKGPEVRGASILVAQGAGFLLQFWVTHRETRDAKEATREVKDEVSTPNHSASIGEESARQSEVIDQLARDLEAIKRTLATRE